jgi:hypothetical protein
MQSTLSMSLSSSMRSAGVNFFGASTFGEDAASALSSTLPSTDIVSGTATFTLMKGE